MDRVGSEVWKWNKRQVRREYTFILGMTAGMRIQESSP